MEEPTVKDIFALRREGRIEEAYNFIRKRYAVHHGHYTTLCMFWCAADMMELRLEYAQRAFEDAVSCTDSRRVPEDALKALHEAEKIGLALERLYPSLRDDEGSAMRKLDYLRALALACRRKLSAAG